MKFVPTPMFESFSGKLGLSVFSTNRAANYIKPFKKPANPSTSRQQNARSLFGAMGSSWFALSAANREDYASWANTSYNPLNPDPRTLAYTGRQAYSALYQAASYDQGFSTELSYSNMIIRDSVVDVYQSENSAAPDAAPSPILADSLLYLSDDGVPGTRAYTWTIDWDDAVGAGKGVRLTFTLASAFQFTTTKNYLIGLGGVTNGIRVYISEALSVDGAKYSQRFRRCILATKSGIFGAWAGATKNTTDLTIGHLYVGSANIPGSAGWYYVTLVASDANGQLKVVGGQYIEIPALS